MTDSAVELVNRAVDAWNRHDAEALAELATEDVEYVNPPTAVEPGTRTGKDALRLVLSKQWEGLGPTARQRIDRLHDLGDVIVLEISITREMPGSDSTIDTRTVVRWTTEAGRLRRIEVLGTGPGFESGRAAAGIPQG